MEPGRKSRIVVVAHQEPTVREIVSEALSAEGLEVHATARGEEAVRLTLEYEPAVLLLSLDLENVDGWRVAAVVREAGLENLLVVALTADAREETRARALASGFSMYITLPVRPSELMTRLRGEWLQGAGAGQGRNSVAPDPLSLTRHP